MAYCVGASDSLPKRSTNVPLNAQGVRRMRSRLFRPLACLSLGALLTGLIGLSGCQSFLNSRYADSLPPEQGIVPVKGLAQSVVIRRNALGMPLIETTTFHDALFALGYVHAGDRLSQMVGLDRKRVV